MESLPARYDPREVEAPTYRWWEEEGFFQAEVARDRDPYVIVIPPPNVTSQLHVGHGLNHTLQDVLVRWRRMQGREALWVPGTDHAGIATQNVVERQLAAEGTSRHELGREAFVRRAERWVEETGGEILQQLRAIGVSVDWSRTRYTLDPGLSAAVREVFVRLHRQGLIYRGKYIINWCPRCRTALSNEEVEHQETDGQLYRFRYPLADGEGHVVVATTRPETMLGDTGIAVHPQDERYRELVGRAVRLPLAERSIPVVADEWVDPEFGTGAVKVTPAHDPNDFLIGVRHDLAQVDVITEEARMSDAVPERFRGLDRFEARRAVVSALREEGLLEGVEAHRHAVGRCYRCDTVVEPRLSNQWFVRMAPLAEPALEAVREGRVRMTPDRWRKVYFEWMENIHDWCISRQLWWGHRIPAWHGPGGAIFVAHSEEEARRQARERFGEEVALRRDPDVLDTWFSSWLWPFSVFGWPERTGDLERFYPTDTLVTGPDILFFWVARMIMAGLEFTGEAPFRDVYLNGIVRDHLNRKMSKSLGNGIDPLEVVERFGADALRYTLVSGAAVGTDILLNHEDLDASFGPGRNFANKVWNVARFALGSLDAEGEADEGWREARAGVASLPGLDLSDRWILSRLARVEAEVDEALERFRLHDAAGLVYGFLWGELADWYLEMVKPRLGGEEGEETGAAARAVLRIVLDETLRLLHPVMPFITEAVWQKLPRFADDPPSIMVSAWPTAVPGWVDEGVEARFAGFREVVTAVRNLRSEYGVPAGETVDLELVDAPDWLRAALQDFDPQLRRLARVGVVGSGKGGRAAQAGASAVLPSGAELFVPLGGVIDLERERERLARELERVEGLVRASEGKLANRAFVERAPAEVVGREREKVASLRDQAAALREKLGTIGASA